MASGEAPSPQQLVTPPGAGPVTKEDRLQPRGRAVAHATAPSDSSVQRAMEFLDTPQPAAAAAIIAAPQRPPRAAVQFEPTGAAASPDHAEVGNVPPETPPPGTAPTLTLPEGWPGGRLADLLLWRRPVASLVAVAVGAGALAAGEIALRGGHRMTLLTGLAYLLLADVAANFGRSMVSARWRDSSAWGQSEVATALASVASGAVHAAASAHDACLTSRDSALTLRAAAVLWALSLLGRLLSVWRLLALGFALAFSVPAAVDANQHRLWKARHDGSRALQARLEAYRVGRGARAAALAAALFIALAFCGWPDRAAAALLALLTVRCHLSASEVDAIVSTTEPYATSAKKRARRLSLAAGELMSRRVSFGGAIAAKPHRR